MLEAAEIGARSDPDPLIEIDVRTSGVALTGGGGRDGLGKTEVAIEVRASNDLVDIRGDDTAGLTNSDPGLLTEHTWDGETTMGAPDGTAFET